jgi:NAD+ diphosphatase
MVGFHADYVSGELHLQQSEIARAGWFRRDNLPTIPEKLSIARMLIDDWLENFSNDFLGNIIKKQ